MIAQAEHDVEASAVLITDSERLAAEVNKELSNALGSIPSANQLVALESLLNNSGILIVQDLTADGSAVVNHNAPEHLQVCLSHPEA